MILYKYAQKEAIRERQKNVIIRCRPGAGDGYPIRENIKGEQYWKCDALFPTDRWLDAGAHIGTFSLIASPFVSMIIAVEPDPGSYQLLVHNCAENACINVAILEGAIIADDRKTVSLYQAKDYNAYNCANTLLPIRGRKDVIEVAGLNINELLRVYHINKIKLDIEGTEEAVLQSIDEDLWPQITDIFFEWHADFLRDRGYLRLCQMIRRLFDIGFNTAWHTVLKKQRNIIVYMSREKKEFPWASSRDVVLHMPP